MLYCGAIIVVRIIGPASLMYSFMPHQAPSSPEAKSAWPPSTIANGDCYVTGVLPVFSSFVILQGCITLADLPACSLPTTLPEHCHFTGVLLHERALSIEVFIGR